jgi:dimethylamine/trimethylamine dehydrogenase
MASQVRRGIVDFIGAARPSIADPFLPKKIEVGRLEDIRECIGCNICYTGDSKATPIRCTQNPTISEEWRRGWHPENIAKKGSDSSVLVVGAGPAGLEATRALGQRGYTVLLADTERELGGRVTRESGLPGLGEWARVRDYRLQQIRLMTNVDAYPDSFMTAEDVLAAETDHVVIATGARWRTDGVGVYTETPINEYGPSDQIFTPDDILAGHQPSGPTIVIDDDHYYMASVIAEKLREDNVPVTFVTPENMVSAWGGMTSEQQRVHARLIEVGVNIITAHSLSAFDGQRALVSCVYSGNVLSVKAEAVVSVTSRLPNESLFLDLRDLVNEQPDSAPKSITRIGDCEAPTIIAGAVFSGHRYARELDTIVDVGSRIKYDRVFFEDG